MARYGRIVISRFGGPEVLDVVEDELRDASAAKHELVNRLGGRAIDYRKEDFVRAVRGLTGGAGVDAVFDAVGDGTGCARPAVSASAASSSPTARSTRSANTGSRPWPRTPRALCLREARRAQEILDQGAIQGKLVLTFPA